MDHDKFKYDVFISHKSDCKPWVRGLAQNLKNNGFKVFLDEWELVPGRGLVDGIYNGLTQSRKGILVVTPGAYDSGWVRDEYNQMLAQRKGEPGFSLIPVVLGKEVPDFPFMKDILYIDFRVQSREEYRKAFYLLYCGLKDQAPGPECRFDGPLEHPGEVDFHKAPPPPGQGETAFIEELFLTHLRRKQAVLLLAQEGRLSGEEKSRILARAEREFGKPNIIHMAPPIARGDDVSGYYAVLGKQCGFQAPVSDSVSLLGAFEDRLKHHGKLFVMISGFENCCVRVQEELASNFRSLCERYSREFRLLACGGERLSNLCYGDGPFSLFTMAQILNWPELTNADVCRLWIERENGGKADPLDQETAGRLLELSGGHPGVLEVCFSLYRDNPGFSEADLMERLELAPFIWQAFNFSRGSEVVKREMCRLLGSVDVGPNQLVIDSCVLKHLYWKNLLKRSADEKRLFWRCPAIQRAGRKILQCE